MRRSSGRGWYGYAPADFGFCWQGDHQLDVWVDGEALGQLDMGDGVTRPYDLDYWNERVPEYLRGELYPILRRSHMLPEMLQIWSGFLVNVPKDWAVEIRPVVNRPSDGFLLYTGLFTEPGLLFATIALTWQHRSVVIPKEQPLFQLQAFPRESEPPEVDVLPFAEWTGDDCRHYHDTVVVPSQRRESAAH